MDQQLKERVDEIRDRLQSAKKEAVDKLPPSNRSLETKLEVMKR